MKAFPSTLSPANKEHFKQYSFIRQLAYMRKAIYELMITGDENNYFDMDTFCQLHSVNTTDCKDMVAVVITELEQLGWHCKTSFGCTGLFVYSTDDPPRSCFPDEL
jgi:hypothetical protein